MIKQFLSPLLVVTLWLFMTQAGFAETDQPQPQTALKLWYLQPATEWEQALPLGNGRLGAMVYGGIAQERIQLNEDTFWAGSPHNNLNPKALDALPEIRQLLRDGRFEAASALAEQSITSQGAQGMPYQSGGQLQLDFDIHGQPKQYYRELDLENAVVRSRFRAGDTHYQREAFVSFVDQAVVLRFTARGPQRLNLSLTLSHPDAMPVQSNAAKAELFMQGKGRDHEGIPGRVTLANLARIVDTDGRVSASEGKLRVEGASNLVVLVTLATNFVNYQDISGDALARAREAMDQAASKMAGRDQYEQRRTAHTEFYQQLFQRVRLTLPQSRFEDEPTDQRIAQFAKRFDPSLVALYFQFGRYLLISSSQPGSQPANLQGLWNPESMPAWDSKYTLNINAEMNYWPAEVTQLSELHEPFFRMIRELAQTGRDTANAMYGARGWAAHHNTDIWRISGGVDWSWGAWPTSSAWLVQHFWQHYLYNGDLTFLESVYPIMREACLFFEDFLVEDPNTGWLIVSPSMSPENASPVTGVKIAEGVTMDNQLLFDLFTHSAAAAQLLQTDSKAIKRWQQLIKRLPPMQIGKYHQLQEWRDDWDSPQDDHRHVSHLYGLYPSNQISPLHTPELAEAARVSLEQRGDPSTGWSMNWKINLWARLLDGNRALKLIGDQIRPAGLGEGDSRISQEGGTYPNMMDAHPPFQIDGNFGFTSGVAEMLAQSHDGAVFLLPALPVKWPQGEVFGLAMRGGFIIDMRWNYNRVTWLRVTSKLGGRLRLRSHAPLPKAQGFTVKTARGDNPNPFYALPNINKPLKHTPLQLPLTSYDNLPIIDLDTQAGGVYLFHNAASEAKAVSD